MYDFCPNHLILLVAWATLRVNFRKILKHLSSHKGGEAETSLMEIKGFSQCIAANKQQACGLAAAASYGMVAACEFFVCKLVLLLLVAATLRLLVAATLRLLVAATLGLIVAATSRLIVCCNLAACAFLVCKLDFSLLVAACSLQTVAACLLQTAAACLLQTAASCN